MFGGELCHSNTDADSDAHANTDADSNANANTITGVAIQRHNLQHE